MILNTTYLDKKKKKIIRNNVGKSIGMFNVLMGQKRGSSRMIIDEYSNGFDKFVNKNNNLLYGNIEIREIGIIVRLQIKNYETVSWLIGYHTLSVFKSKYFSIHSAGEFVKFRRDSNFLLNKKFISQLFDKKNNIQTHIEQLENI